MRTILWDFDGVILDSMKIRDKGFEIIFKKFEKSKVDQLLEYHRINGGLSRYVKIKYFYNEILGKEISDEKVLEYASNFSKVMREKLIDPNNLIQESVTFIKNNYKKYNFHIVSGSDQKELRFLCKELQVDCYFISIYGSPTPKNDLVSNVIQQFDYNKNNTCLIGDSINDFEAADKNKIKFYGYNNLLLKEAHSYVDDFKRFIY
jgi:phosphoglycolate phosphatase-like HAD superfamily hydrolase